MIKASVIILFLFSNFLSCPTRHGGFCHATGDIDGDGLSFTANDYNDFVDYLAGVEIENFDEYQADFNADCIVDNRDFKIFECNYNHGKDCTVGRAVTACCEATHCCQGTRGDVNGSGKIDIADLTFLINYVMKNGPEPNCFMEADLNTDDIIDSLDIERQLDLMFRGGPIPPDCFED